MKNRFYFEIIDKRLKLHLPIYEVIFTPILIITNYKTSYS